MMKRREARRQSGNGRRSQSGASTSRGNGTPAEGKEQDAALPLTTRQELEVYRANLAASRAKEDEDLRRKMAELDFEENQRQEQLAQEQTTMTKVAGVDLLFLLDATLSMQPYAAKVAEQLHDIVQGMDMMSIKPSLRVGVVAYRDFGLKQRIQFMKFTAVSKTGGTKGVRNFINGLVFASEKENSDVRLDESEDVHGGLEAAASPQMGWDKYTRIIIHIADAPGHGNRLAPNIYKEYRQHGFSPDYLPDFDADGMMLTRLLMDLKQQVKVTKYYFLHLEDLEQKRPCLTKNMLARFQQIVKDNAWITELDWSDVDLANQVLDSISDSISVSFSLSQLDANGQQREFELDTVAPDEIDWSSNAEVLTVTQNVSVSWNYNVGTINRLLELMKEGKFLGVARSSNEQAALRITRKAFDNGQTRLVYHGRFYPNGLTGTYQQVVLKEFIATGHQVNAAEAYKAQMMTHSVARFLAKSFMQQAKEDYPSISRMAPVEYIEAVMVSYKKDGQLRFMFMEPYLEGAFKKFNSNAGGVAKDAADFPQFQAFSHWTYEATNHELMVVDVQGAQFHDKDGYRRIYLTDPAIHSRKRKYFSPLNSSTNLVSGPQLFLDSHHACNLHGSLCTAMVQGVSDFRRAQSAYAWDTERQDKVAFWPGFQNIEMKGDVQLPPRGVGRPGPAGAGHQPQPPELDSMRTTTTVVRRVQANKESIKLHCYLARLLRNHGIHDCPGNLFDAINLCASYNLGQAAERKHVWHSIRQLANLAKHDLNKKSREWMNAK